MSSQGRQPSPGMFVLSAAELEQIEKALPDSKLKGKISAELVRRAGEIPPDWRELAMEHIRKHGVTQGPKDPRLAEAESRRLAALSPEDALKELGL